jgi:hypothetical protein
MPCICRPQTTDAENNYKTRKKMILFTHAWHILNSIRRPQTTDAENNYKTRKKKNDSLYSCLAYFEFHMQTTSDYICGKDGRGAPIIKHKSEIEIVGKPVGNGYFAQK